MNRPFHVYAVHGLYLYGRRVGPRFLFRCQDRETGPPPAGRMRRSHKDAHNHHGDGAQREVDGRRLRHLGHTRFRVSLGLHGVLALGNTDYILTRRNRLGNTDRSEERRGGKKWRSRWSPYYFKKTPTD